jgi:putative transposase
MTPKGPLGKKRPPVKPSFLDPNAIIASLEDLFPESSVIELAKSSGYLKRKRLFDPYYMLWALVLGFGITLERTLAGAKRQYEEITDTQLSYSTWYEKFTPELVRFLRSCVALGLSKTAQAVNRTLGEKLKRFEDVVIQDSTVVRLHKALAKKFPATRSRKVAAGVKVATLISAVANGIKTVAIYGERTGEVKTIRIGKWIKDRVILLDLGYFKYQLFARIVDNGGFFVSRLKNNADPLIESSLKVHRGRAIELGGKRWSDVKDLLMRDVLDAEVSMAFKRRKYKGKITGDTLNLRLVAIYDTDDKRYHVYITNIPQEVLSAEDVAALYSVRWEIELVFKELKSRYALDLVKTTNEHIAEGLIWTAILTMIVSRRLYNLLRSAAPKEKVRRYTPLLWAIVFVETSHKLRDVMTDYFRDCPERDKMLNKLAWLWEIQAISPHVNRKRLSDKLEA